VLIVFLPCEFSDVLKVYRLKKKIIKVENWANWEWNMW
jgi:hypothetical protein